MLPRLNLLFAILLCTIVPLYSSAFYFDKITTRSGLSQSSVFSIIQDHRGSIWFGSFDGLNRYNGHEFTVFRPENGNPYSIANNEIFTLFEDSQHRLWIGFLQKGMDCYDPKTEKFIHYTRSAEGIDISSCYANAFVEDRQGIVWVATSRGLFFIDHQGKIHQDKSELGVQNLASILLDEQGNLWLGEENGRVWQKETATNRIIHCKFIEKKNQITPSRINFIFQNQDGHIFVCTKDRGLWKLNPQSTVFEPYLYFPGEREGRNNMRKIVSNAQHLWIATDGGLIHADSKINLNSVECIKPAQDVPGALSSHAVLNIYLDRFANLWIGLWEGGGVNVLYAQKPTFQVLSTKNGLPTNKINGIAYARDRYYVATGKGVAVFDRNFNKVKDLLPLKDVNRVASNQDYVVFGVWNDGFYLLSTKDQKVQHYFTQLVQQNLRGIPQVSFASVTSKGIWLCTAQEYAIIYFMDFATRRFIPIVNFKSSTSINSILESTLSNIIWVGTPNKGLWRYNLQTHQLKKIHLNGQSKETFNERNIVCTLRNSLQTFWVGTHGGGLFLLDETGKVLQHYTTEKGLANNVIHSLQKDRQGRLWIATNEGLSRFNPTDRSFRNYTEIDDLGSKEFLDGASGRGYDNQLLFGGIHGLNIFFPDSIVDNRVKPIVAFTDLLLLNQKTIPLRKGSPLKQSIDFTKKIRLSHQQSYSITFEYVGIYYNRNHQCSYAYKLEGFDQKWNKVGSRRAATYTNLNPGHYTFKVKAANPEGGWNELAKSIQVHILPPWYLQWWAYLIYIALFITAFIQYRTYITNQERLKAELRLKELEANNARQLEQLKTDFFNDISHELRTPLTLILDPAERLSTENNLNSAQIKNFSSIIQSNAQRLFRLVNQLLDLAKITADKYQLHIEFHDLIALFNETINAFKYQLTKQDIQLVFNTQVDTLYAWFDADALEKMLFNLLSNAIKAKSTLIEITISIDYDLSHQPQVATIRIRDNGVGIPENQISRLFERFYQVENEEVDASLGTGVGLSLVAELVRIHRGQIQVDSKHGKGTTFILYLPINEQAFPSEWLAKQWLFKMEQSTENQVQETDQYGLEQGASIAHKNRKVVLIAEDNTEMRHYLQENFANQFNVISCSNGQEAFHQAMEHIPDIVVSDLVMPVMDGIALCAALKQNELTSHIPIILLTSRSMVESQLKGLHAGADDYITKPFHLNLLLARAINLMNQREALSTRIAQSPLHALTHKELLISETDENFLKKVIDVIDLNISNTEFGVEQLEEALLMGRMQLYRKLTSLTSMSGNAFIRHIRLQRASELLEKSNLSIAEIAYRVGFNSPSYFTQIYKKTFGKLPSRLNSK